MFPKVKNDTIAARLIASFVLINVIFFAYAAMSIFILQEASRRHAHNNDFITARTEIILDFNQEFAEMRRLLRVSFLDPEWLEVTGFTVWRDYERRLSESYRRMSQLSEAYITSIRTDTVFPVEPDDRRVCLMEEVMVYVSALYSIFSQNYFQGRYMNFIPVDLLDYTEPIEKIIREIRLLISYNREANAAAISHTERIIRIVTTVAVILGSGTSVVVAVLMIKSFTGRIKTIKARAKLVAEGNFEVDLQDSSDEISRIFTEVISVFNELTDEINTVAGESSKGNSSARIRDSHFKGGYKTAAMAINSMLDAVSESQDRIQESLDRIIAAEENNKLMLDGNPSACCLIDKNLSVLDCNKSAISLFGFADRADALKKIMDIFTGIGLEKFNRHLSTAFKEGRDEFAWDINKPDGSAMPCEITLVSLALNDGQVAAVYMKDMTDVEKMLEQKEKTLAAEENSRAKSKFLATMSHEIRTPITAVLGIAEIQLQSPDLPMALEEAFAKIYDSAGLLLNIIDDLLDISKIESGKMELIDSEYETASLVTDTMQVQIAYIGSKPVDFKVEVDENMPAHLRGDELRLKQIINNILSNAFKYTDKGSVTLKIYCEYPENHSDGAPCGLHIIVADTGKGMTAPQVAALKDEYTRFHEKTSSYIKGTGLGMSIVGNLLDLMGGTIDVKSRVGKGTTVTMYIPQVISGDKKLGKETAGNLRKLDFAALSGVKKLNFKQEPMPYGSVLVVDDIETNLYVARGLMELYSLKIETVTSGIAAVNKVKKGNVYDIIFMDHMMPEMNGIEAAKIIRGMGYNEPIVALTANALIGQSEEFMRNGFNGFVSKPIQTMHLNAILNKFIRDKQPPEVIAAANAAPPADNSPKAGGFLLPDSLSVKIFNDFLKTQRNIMPEIYAAIKANDYVEARLLAHTLKGYAGLMKENSLIDAAGKVEASFKSQMESAELLASLEREVTSVIAKVDERFKDKPAAKRDSKHDLAFDKDAASKLFDRLGTLLSQDSGDAEDLISDLEKIPHTGELVSHILDFEFDAALEEMKTVRKNLNV